MKKIISIALVLGMISSLAVFVWGAEEKMPFDVAAESAVLMEAETGTVLYAKSPHTPLPPASVTKIMTLLLVMEEIERKNMSLSDMISVSEYAASMGGSQVFLEEGEEMSCEDMLKSVVISSANDGAVALAEAVAGTEESFVSRMNERARELGMKDTNFENVTGLDDDTTNHTISAYDIALASRELITKHPKILEYSSIWMDSIRGGEFGLTNTNRLIRFYKGATGLKTGSTSKAGFCISATAKRDGVHLIAVIMGSETRDARNNAAKQLLDYGFSNYEFYETEEEKGEKIKVVKGVSDYVKTEISPFKALVEKNSSSSVEIKTEYKDKIIAPVEKGTVVGKAEFFVGKEKIGEADIVCRESVGRLDFGEIFKMMLKNSFLK